MKKNVLLLLLLFVFSFAAIPAFAVIDEAMGNPYEAGTQATRYVVNYYRVNESKVVALADDIYKNDGFPDDVLATLEIACLSGRDLMVIHKDRRDKMTWAKILEKYEIHPSRLFKPVKAQVIPSLFKNAYLQYYAWEKNKQAKISLTDRDVRYLSGMKMVSDVFRKDPLEVMQSFYDKITFTWILVHGM